MMSQRKSPDRGPRDRSSVDLESGSEEGVDKFTSGILTYLWVQCYKTIGPDETLSRFIRGDGGLRKPEEAARAANSSTVRLSSGISANILDFGLPQKHVLRTCRRGARPQGRLLKDRHHQQRRGAGATTAS